MPDNNGKTALHYAADLNSFMFFKYLVDIQELDINAKDKEGWTPIMLALLKGHEESIFEAYKQTKCTTPIKVNDSFTYNNEKHTMVSYVAKYGGGVPVNMSVNPLDSSAKSAFTRIKFLVSQGCDINYVDENGWGCLVYAIRQNDLQFFELLAGNCKPNMDILDNEGKSLAHHVITPRIFGSYENTSMLDSLKKFNGNMTVKDKKNRLPIQYAQLQESGVMLEKLKQLGVKAASMPFDLKRQQSSIISGFGFKATNYNFEEDAEEFNKKMVEDSKEKLDELLIPVKIESHILGQPNLELVYQNNDKMKPMDLLMVKVDINRGYYSGNVFYKMQIVREKIRDVYILSTRWGRVGTDGQYQQTPFGSYEECRVEFCKIFKSKSGNVWENRENFVKQDKKYRLIPFKAKYRHDNYIKGFDLEKCKKSELTPTILKFLYTITRAKTFNNGFKFSCNIDTDTLPLQDLTKERLMDAQAVLDSISIWTSTFETHQRKREMDEMEKCLNELNDLSNTYYELIPLKDNTNTSIAPLTNTSHIANEKKKLHDLMYYEIVIKLICGAYYKQYKVGPYDYIFNCLSFNMEALAKNTEEFQIINTYINNGYENQQNRCGYYSYNQKKTNMYIANVYAVERKGEREKFNKFQTNYPKSTKNSRMLLWHGTKDVNCLGILQTGFRIAPSEVVGCFGGGSMFGEGVYFADRFDKALNYTNNNVYNNSYRQMPDAGNSKFLFLCEVFLGNNKKMMTADHDFKLGHEYNSVKGVGMQGPNPQKNIYLANGCAVPVGEHIPWVADNNKNAFKTKGQVNAFGGQLGSNQTQPSLQWNEYVVYDTAQVFVRYLVEVKYK